MSTLDNIKDKVNEILAQLDISDAYAVENKKSEDALPTVTELQNSHIRGYAKEILHFIEKDTTDKGKQQ